MILITQMHRVKTLEQIPHISLILAVGVLFSLFTPTTQAMGQTLPYPDIADWGVATIGLGGANAAVSYNHDSFLGNPAGLVFFQGKSSVSGAWIDLPGKKRGWEIGIIDGTRDFVGGFHFRWMDVNPSGRRSYSVAAAYKTQYGSLGVSAHAFEYTGLSGAGNGWYWTHGLGVLVPITYGISFGASTKAYFDTHEDAKLPPNLNLGLAYSKDPLRVTYQADRRFGISGQDWNHSFGSDFVFMKYFGARAGYRMDNSMGFSYWSVGGSFLAPRMEIGGFFLRTTEGPKESGIGFDAAVKF